MPGEAGCGATRVIQDIAIGVGWFSLAREDRAVCLPVLLFVDVGEREREDGWKSGESRPSPLLDCVAVLFMASSNPKPAWRITVVTWPRPVQNAQGMFDHD